MKQVTKNEKVRKSLSFCTHHYAMIGMFNMLRVTATRNDNREKVILVEKKMGLTASFGISIILCLKN